MLLSWLFLLFSFLFGSFFGVLGFRVCRMFLGVRNVQVESNELRYA